MNGAPDPFDGHEIDRRSWAYGELISMKQEWTPRQKPRGVGASAMVNPLDDLVRVSGTATMTLESAIGCDGRRHTFKLVSAGTMTIACSGGQTIDGAATLATATLYTSYTVMSNGATWDIV